MKAFDQEKLKKVLKARKEKIEHINEFLSDLTSFIEAKAQDAVDSANVDLMDSCVGLSYIGKDADLEKSLYKLFGIEIEEEKDEH